jgi:hypothetical protein
MSLEEFKEERRLIELEKAEFGDGGDDEGVVADTDDNPPETPTPPEPEDETDV